MIYGQTNTVEHRSTITKAPLRDIHSHGTLKRFGHVWLDDTYVKDYKPMKRWSTLWPHSISILDDYNPYTRRYSCIWPDSITTLKVVQLLDLIHTSDLVRN